MRTSISLHDVKSIEARFHRVVKDDTGSAWIDITFLGKDGKTYQDITIFAADPHGFASQQMEAIVSLIQQQTGDEDPLPRIVNDEMPF